MGEPEGGQVNRGRWRHEQGEKPLLRLHVGQSHACGTPAVLQTLLGSCVATCLFDPARRIGGMNHVFLPDAPGKTVDSVVKLFGINAMELLINQMLKLGAGRTRLVAKVFGGARVLGPPDARFSPGAVNVTFVEQFLEAEQIPVLARDTGGDEPRTVYFHTDTGEVYLRRLRSGRAESLVRREEEAYRAATRRELRQGGDVTLFSEPGRRRGGEGGR